MKTTMGRPKGKALLEKDKILKAALHLLDEDGSQGLSMRSLAHHLKVTPMALYHHYSDRSSLLRNVSDMVYSEVTKAFNEFSGTPKARLEFLLISYHKAVIMHPNLSIGIFESPEAFSTETQNITQHLHELISFSKVTKSKQIIWFNILIDFTHGSSIATAKSLVQKKRSIDFVEVESRRFFKELKVLVECIF